MDCHRKSYNQNKLYLMNLRLTALPLALVCSVAAFADADITGKVISKSSGEPMDFANVQLLNAAGKALPIGVQTDENGNFTIPKVASGKYLVRISYLGSVTQDRPVTVANTPINVGTIKLAEDSKVLQEVVVQGVAGQMRFELDKRVFNVDADLVATGSSASDLLESIPSVDVDQDGEVSLRGDSSVTIWINGKESGLTADNRAQILEQIPGETIEKVEVITNPSAKYSPEGTSGIINIVLKKDRRGGYFGAAEIGANSRGGGNANFSFNYNNNKWDAFASIGFRMRHGSNGSWSHRTYHEDVWDQNGTFLNSVGEGKNHGNNLFFRLGATYHLTSKDDISLSGFGMFGHRWSHSSTEYTTDQPDYTLNPDDWDSNINITHSRGDNRGAHAELGYTHKFSDTHSLDATLSFNHWGGPNRNYYDQHREYPFADDPVYDLYQTQEQSIKSNSVEAKIDYTNQLTSWLKLEAGYNGNYSHENTPVKTWEGVEPGPDLNPANLATRLWNQFIYNNNISALYVTLGGKVKNFSFSAGLRSEAWQVRTKSLAYGQSEEETPWTKINKFALFPSAFLSYSLPHDNEIQINYTRRIRRPWGGQLNSFEDISNPTNISYGNPELEPQYSNAFELNYIKNWSQHTLSVSAYMRTSDKVMSRISYMYGGIMYTTTANVTNRLNSGVEIVGKNSLFRNVLNLTTTVNLYQSHLSAWNIDFNHRGTLIPVSGRKQNSFSWDARLMAQVRLPWGMSLQATGRYASKRVEAQGQSSGGWSVDAGLRKSLGNWSFTLNCRDIFDSRKRHSWTYGDTYDQESNRWRAGRTLQLTIKYSFGNLKRNNRRDMMDEGEPMDGSGYGESDF